MALEGGIKFDLPEAMGDTLQFITTLRCRTLFLRGQASGVLGPDMHRKMAGAAHKSECGEIAGAGHAVMVDNPEGTAERTASFVRRLLSASVGSTH
jgi:pimeloyl-ACP methyl ester carboxylesterase